MSNIFVPNILLCLVFAVSTASAERLSFALQNMTTSTGMAKSMTTGEIALIEKALRRESQTTSTLFDSQKTSGSQHITSLSRALDEGEVPLSLTAVDAWATGNGEVIFVVAILTSRVEGRLRVGTKCLRVTLEGAQASVAKVWTARDETAITCSR